jgi:tetratricopeptide (TPR) repeat protein
VTIVAYIALFGWVPAIVVFFALLPSRRAATVAVIGAWLLLPPYQIPISNFPDYSKNTAATLGMLLGTLFFSPDRILAFRPRWFDLPMVLWCFCGVASSLQNGLGLYDGLSDSLRQLMYWGLPYLLGRWYFGNLESLRAFSIAMIVGGLAYVIPCLWEARMSPQLLGNVYGFTKWQGTRLGGFRPHVFFYTGLELGMWMSAVSLTAWWLWLCGVVKKFGPMSFGRVLLPILLGTSVLCRSTGALVLLAGGMILLWASNRFKTRMLLYALVLFGPLYVALRIPNLWSGQQLVDLAKASVGADRAQSLEYRFMCENLLVAKALEQPVFGWGAWGRSSVYFSNDYRDDGHKVPTDGLWIITLGSKGFIGLSLLYLVLGLPAILFLWHFPVRLWRHPHVAPATLAATFLGLYIIDCLLNGFINIIYVTLAGGLISLTPVQFAAKPQPKSRGRQETSVAPITRQTTVFGHVPVNASSAPLALFTGTGEIELADHCRSLGRASKKQGRLSEAQEAWRRALHILTELTALHPNAPDLQNRWCDCANDLAWLQLNHAEPACFDPISALALASEVVERCSTCGVYWNTLGVACFRAGDLKGAVAALSRATTIESGGSAFDYIFLAMAHARLGNREEARRWFTLAMNRKERDYPGHPELDQFCNEAQSILAVAPTSPASTF